MKHIVFLVGGYFPYYSAVGKCIGNIADVFSNKKQNYHVTIICQLSREGQATSETYKGQRILRISTPRNQRRIELVHDLRTAKGLRKIILNIALFHLRVSNYVYIILKKNSLDQTWIQAYENGLSCITEPIDILIPTCSPFETIVAALHYHKEFKATKLIPILFDLFSASRTLHRTKRNRILKQKLNRFEEEKMLSQSDRVFHVPTWSIYLKTYFPHYCNKTVEIEHPLIIASKIAQNEVCRSITPSTRMAIVFAGILTRYYVEPDYVLNLAAKIVDPTEFKFMFYSIGNACGLVKRRNLPNVELHGWVTREILETIIQDAAMCLSIAEKNGKQISSKIFEYMSLGKPIIHIYYESADINLRYLRQYPLALCIQADMTRLEEHANLLVEWYRRNQKKRVVFSKTRSIFQKCTPEFIEMLLENEINALV